MTTRSTVLLCCALLGCTFSLDRTLSPGDLRGHVVVLGPSGSTVPAAGAIVTVPNSTTQVTTDTQGRFVLSGLGGGEFSLMITYAPNGPAHPDSVLGITGLQIPPGDGLDLGTVKLAVAGSVTGVVRLAGENTPVANAVLTLLDSGGNPIPGLPAATSDSIGHYTIPFAPQGALSVKALFVASPQAFTAMSQPLTVMPRQQTTQDILLTAPTAVTTLGSVTGRATYANPVSGVSSVTVTLSSPTLAPIVQPDQSPAAFAVASVPAGIYTLLLSAKGAVPVEIDNVAVEGDTDVGTIVFTQALPAANECAMNNGGCDTHAACQDVGGAATCTCSSGYEGGGITCADVNECLTNNGGCDAHATCTNTPGSFTCACNTGFTGDGLTCLDANECGDGTAHCDPHATCTNTPGSFTCACNTGFTGDGQTCVPEIPALTVDPNAVEYLISPWGNGSGETIGGNLIPAGRLYALVPPNLYDASAQPIAASAFKASTGPIQQINVYADSAKTLPLGSLAPNSDGSWPVKSLDFNSAGPVAYVAAVDQNGVESPAVPIQNNEWVATPNLTNQHGIWAVSDAQLPLAQPTAGTTDLRENPAVFGNGQAATLVTSQMPWTQWHGSSPPSARRDAAMAFDFARNRLVLFGGLASDGTTLLNDTWEWDGMAWTQLNPLTPPAARSGHAMVYDSATGTVLLFGGSLGPGQGDPDLYEWDGSNWTDLKQGDTTHYPVSPSARSNTVFVYDYAADQAVLVGGRDTSGAALGDVFIWDDHGWTPESGSLPGSRYNAAGSFDGTRTIVYGGTPDGSSFLTDTWVRSGGTWTQFVASGPTLDATGGFAIVGSLLLGGTMGGMPNMNFYEFGGSSWAATGGGPSLMSFASASNPNGVPYVFGGVDPLSGNYQNGLWSVGGSGLNDITPDVATPSPRAGHAMAYDSSRRTSVLFGGTNQPSGQAFADTWEWNGARWINRTPSSGGPTARAFATATYDSTRHVTEMFGGRSQQGPGSAELWEWDGTTWTNRTPGTTLPSACCQAGFVYDASNKLSLMFGGTDWGNATVYGETWVWDGAAGTLTKLSPALSPSARRIGAMTLGAQIMLFGGLDSTDTFLGDTWLWNGTTWSQATPTNAPPARTLGMGEFDDNSNVARLYGGYTLNSSLQTFDDNWQWDGMKWTQEVQSPTAGQLSEGAMVFDSSRNQTVLFGGMDAGNNFRGETWLQDNTPQRLAAFQFDAQLGLQAIDPSAITEINVRAICGSSTSHGGSSGVALMGWQTTGMAPGWQPLTSNTVGLASAAPYVPASTPPMTWASNSAAEAQSFVVKGSDTSSFRCIPLNDTQFYSGEETVGVSYMEVRVKYKVTP